jgi:hypothetical protein
MNQKLENYGRQTNSERRDKLGQSDEEKIEVEKELELLVEHDRKKGERIVLLISYNVRRIL